MKLNKALNGKIKLYYCDHQSSSEFLVGINKMGEQVKTYNRDCEYNSEREAISVAKRYFKLKKANKLIRKQWRGRIWEVINYVP